MPTDDVKTEFGEKTQIDFDIAFYEQILLRNPDYIDVLCLVGELLTRRGFHARALVVDRKLARLLPDDSTVLYNLACSLSLSGLIPEAIVALRTALTKGYSDFEHLELDRDLDNLRDEPEYAELLKEYGSSLSPE
jgi:tetratricopeptide (TPR) repeat protein